MFIILLILSTMLCRALDLAIDTKDHKKKRYCLYILISLIALIILTLYTNSKYDIRTWEVTELLRNPFNIITAIVTIIDTYLLNTLDQKIN